MKLYTTTRSPFGRKVYLMAIEKGLKGSIELVMEDLKNRSSALLKNNPLGLVPVLVLDNGETVFDSSVIADYIDEMNDSPKLIPSLNPQRTKVLKLSALADGMVENAVFIFYENLKASNKQPFDEAKTKRCYDTLERCLKALEKEVDNFGRTLDMAQIAAFSALGYINFRINNLGWEKNNPKLAKWFTEFSKRPSAIETMPKD